jgi:hypothetical protein
MPTWYAQNSAAWASITWNDVYDGSGSVGSPTSGDTADSNGQTVTVDGVDLTGITLSGIGWAASTWYARSTGGISSATWNARSDGAGCSGTPSAGNSLYSNGYAVTMDADGYTYYGTDWIAGSISISVGTIDTAAKITVPTSVYFSLSGGTIAGTIHVNSGGTLVLYSSAGIGNLVCEVHGTVSQGISGTVSVGTWYFYADSTLAGSYPFIIGSGCAVYLGPSSGSDGKSIDSYHFWLDSMSPGYLRVMAVDLPADSKVENGTVFNYGQNTGTQPSVAAIAAAIWDDTASPSRTLTA